MIHRRVRVTAFLAVLASGWIVAARAAEIPDVMEAIAARLDLKQIKQGVEAGNWDKDWGYNGSIVAGMVDAYECLWCATYKASAVLGGKFILWQARCDSFMGDELYALQRLSVVDDGPDGDQWRIVVHRFFDEDVGNLPQNVAFYACLFDEMDPSTAVFYQAHFAVAAHLAGVEGADHWRQALIDRLARVADDKTSFPVMALGVATWALARTGELDETLIGHYDREPYWKGVRLCDLPGLLAGHQVPEGEEYAGSFYWRFDHTFGPFPGPLSGYTEDTIYGTMGLVAVASLEKNPSDCGCEERVAAIRAAARILADGVDADGKVYEHLAREGCSYYAFGGEMLQVLCDLQRYLQCPPTPEPPDQGDGGEQDGECGECECDCPCDDGPTP
jgi:hypothetical protein